MKLICGSGLDIQAGIEWLESIAISHEKADVRSNYKVLYVQEGPTLRTSESDEALKYSDCSELVCRYLQKIGWSEKVKHLNTSGLDKFAKKHPDLLVVQDENYIPKKGDIFLWVNHSGSNGHTGVVVDYNKSDDVVTTIEAINFKERPHGASKAINLQGVAKLKWKRTSRHLINHPTVTKRYTADPCRFITPSKK
ncbi:CHAP domain-containing protein [Olleya sp. YSTF-M6]|uniref:CHAP domain-containing protein n=1 Tax=Olleya sediminilitoris TaxID=2795739 RepID=A0ABS1WLB4_9FLAO|nr:CHAP domain-containing protein [Olleya sediminilitoris]MBL7559917.1 CHAP domain-containing protein [Olleya sediminilitoris]